MNKTLELDINRIAERSTIRVTLTGMRRFKVRTWLAMTCLQLAWWILPFNVEVVEEEGGE